MGRATNFKPALGALIVATILMGGFAWATGTGTSSSGTTTSLPAIIPTSTCANMINDAGSAFGNAGAYTSLLGYAVLIMLAMVAVAGLIYALGYAFGIDKMTRFSKSELGEIAVTAIVVGVLIGTWSAATAAHSVVSGTGILPIAGGQFSSQVFVSNCNYLIGGSEQILTPLVVLALENIPLSLASSTTISLEPTGFGIAFKPLAGLSFLNGLLGLLVSIGGMIFGVLFGFGAFMAIIYALFPIFLFVGIVLRTIPVTRPAGGAFLGLFVGFYIFFPLLLNLMLTYLQGAAPVSMAMQFCSSPVSGTNVQQYFNAISSCFGSAGLTFGALTSGGSGLINGFTSLLEVDPISIFVVNVIEPAFYTLLAVIMALLLSYDFMETLASLLGSPSLKSHTALKNVI